MNIKVGDKFMTVRDDRKLTQAEMADILGMSVSAYARIEKNLVSPSIDELVRYSKVLEVPLQEFFPETVAINNKSDNQSGGIVFVAVSASNTNNYYGADATVQAKELEIEVLKKEVERLKSLLGEK